MSEKSMVICVDARGEVCPYPMIKAVEAMKRAQEGQVVEVLTDHPPALETIPTQAKRLGFTWDIERVGNPEWRIRLERKGG